MSLASVRAFAAAWNSRAEPALAGLVNNAGIFSMGTRVPERCEGGLEAHWATNFLAPTLLTLLLLPALRRVEGARVVNVSSSLHLLGEVQLADPSFQSRRYTPLAAYAQSKLASLAFLRELERRVEEKGAGCAIRGIRFVSVHPGNIVTGVVRTLPRLVQVAYRAVMSSILLSLTEGARSTVFCFSSPQVATQPRPTPYYESGCTVAQHAAAADDAALRDALWKYTLSTLGVEEGAVLA